MAFADNNTSLGSSWASLQPTDFGLAPVGLGTLLYAGYVGDARTFYCPSGESDAVQKRMGTVMTSGQPLGLPHWQMAGGYSRETMDGLTGGWKNNGTAYSTAGWGANFPCTCRAHYSTLTNCTARVMACDYAYRNCANPYVSNNAQSDNPFTDSGGYYHGSHNQALLYVKPQIKQLNFNLEGNAGMPMFKTQKLQMGRGLVCDFFGKPTTLKFFDPGPGIYCHRDGYNVLYGDARCLWNGDPKQDAIWQDMTGADGGSGNYENASSAYSGGTWLSTDSSGYAMQRWPWQMVWHSFDTLNGVDAGNLSGANQANADSPHP